MYSGMSFTTTTAWWWACMGIGVTKVVSKGLHFSGNRENVTLPLLAVIMIHIHIILAIMYALIIMIVSIIITVLKVR